MAQAISLNMRGESAGMRSKWLTLLNQLLHRINVASHAALHRQAMRSNSRHPPDGAEADAKGAHHPLMLFLLLFLLENVLSSAEIVLKLADIGLTRFDEV